MIKGKVINQSTGTPIAGSSVFISNTSKGTSTNNEGNFELNNVPAGKHELVISSIGFETTLFSFSDNDLPLQLKVEMKIKVKELANVTVEPWVEEGWDKWGRTFIENFIGSTPNAARCRILNAQVIKFRYYKNSRRVVAYADEPLQIDNKGLGYRITYQLENFEVNFQERQTVFVGYSLFEEQEKDKKSWERRRKQAYYGSMLHFMRSLYRDSLIESGFQVRRMKRIYNPEKARIRSLYKPTQIVKTNSGTGATPINIQEPNFHADSIAYYRQVMQQPEYEDSYGSQFLTSDSLIVNQEKKYKLLYFTDYISITYTKELEEQEYMRTQVHYRRAGFQQSFLYLPRLKAVWIEANGNYFDPLEIYSLGYWSWSDKIADNLPLDYEPPRE